MSNGLLFKVILVQTRARQKFGVLKIDLLLEYQIAERLNLLYLDLQNLTNLHRIRFHFSL